MVTVAKFLLRVTVFLMTVIGILVPDVPAWVRHFVLDVNVLKASPCVDQNVTCASKVRSHRMVVHEKQAPYVSCSNFPLNQRRRDWGRLLVGVIGVVIQLDGICDSFQTVSW